MYRAINGVAYGRCDIRMNEQGELFVLEINPKPAIFLTPEEYGPADYMILYDKGRYKLFLDRIIKHALNRHQMKMSEK
jgi:D-alanine-D-alanine ligase